MRAMRLQAARLGFGASGHHQRRPPSTMPLALPAVTVPFLPNAGFSEARISMRRLRTQMVVLLHHPRRCGLADYLQRGDLFLEDARLRRRAPLAVASARRTRPSLPARCRAARREVGGVRHVETAMRVEQRDHERVFELAFTEPEAGPRAADHVRRLRHGFHPAGEPVLRLAQSDHLRHRHDGLHARTAEPIHRQRGSLDRNAGLQRHVPSAIDRVARRLLRVAEHGVVELRGLDAGTPDRFGRCDRGQFHGGEVAQFAAITPHRRASAAYDSDVCSLCHKEKTYCMKSLIEQGKLLSLSVGTRASNQTPTSVVGHQDETGSPLRVYRLSVFTKCFAGKDLMLSSCPVRELK